MKKFAKHTLFVLLSVGFVIISSGQTKDEQIKLIRKKFQQINSDTTLRKVTLESEEFLEETPDNGGELTGYYENRKIKKIYEWIGLSNGINTSEFYFDNEQLIFVFEKFDSFLFDDKKGEFDLSKTKTIFEGRFYFNNKKLFSKSTKGDKSLAAQGESTEKVLLERASENLGTLNKKAN